MKKRILNIILLTAAIFVLFNCTKAEKSAVSSHKIVITSPEVAEIVYQLQGAENIIGVTMECNFPAALQEIPRIGTFGRIDLEKVVSLQPDIVFVSGLEQNYLAAELLKLDIHVEKIYPSSLTEMLQSINRIAEILNIPARGKHLADSLSAEINNFRKTLPAVRPRIYVEIYGDPIMSVADSSFIGELVELAGFDNIFASLPRDYCRISPEAVLAADPEYILLLYPGITREQVQARKGWSRVTALRNNKIYSSEDIDPDLLLRATPRSLEGVRLLRKLIEEKDD